MRKLQKINEDRLDMMFSIPNNQQFRESINPNLSITYSISDEEENDDLELEI